jgi:hypothetical protein
LKRAPIRRRNEREFPEEIVQTVFHHFSQRTGRVKGNRRKGARERMMHRTRAEEMLKSRVKSSWKSEGLKFEASPLARAVPPYLRDFQLHRLGLDTHNAPRSSSVATRLHRDDSIIRAAIRAFLRAVICFIEYQMPSEIRAILLITVMAS